jgi:predicted amidohydrolase YtcJ
MDGAFARFEESEKGTLSPGKLADFIVLDRDLLSVTTDQLKDIRVLETYVGGQHVHRVQASAK